MKWHFCCFCFSSFLLGLLPQNPRDQTSPEIPFRSNLGLGLRVYRVSAQGIRTPMQGLYVGYLGSRIEELK